MLADQCDLFGVKGNVGLVLEGSNRLGRGFHAIGNGFKAFVKNDKSFVDDGGGGGCIAGGLGFMS